MLNVFLGYGCNLSCSYCLQAPMAARERTHAKRTNTFVERVVPWAIENDIREIAYWGGEPVLYWPQIREIHNAFLAAGHRFDMVKIATNGTLWTEAHVRDANEWGAYVILSRHHGQGEPAWEAVKRLDNLSLSYLFTGQALFAWPWFAECQALEQSMGRQVHPYVHWVRATEGCDPDYYITHEQLDLHLAHLWTLAGQAANGERLARSMWRGHLMHFNGMMAADGLERAPAMCFGPHQYDVDLQGNRYNCHHTVEPGNQTGKVFDSSTPATLEERAATDQARRFRDTPECTTCELVSWCRGNCHLSETHDVDCRLSKGKAEILSWLTQHWGEDNEHGPRFVHA